MRARSALLAVSNIAILAALGLTASKIRFVTLANLNTIVDMRDMIGQSIDGETRKEGLLAVQI